MQKTLQPIQVDLKDILETLYDKFNRPEFIADDPICIPHGFSKKEDIEIAGFLTASIAWGQRSQIIKNANLLMQLMDRSPYDFILNAGGKDICRLERFYYRTFKFTDLNFFIRSLNYLYKHRHGLEGVFTQAFRRSLNVKDGLIELHDVFRSIPHEQRSMKHLSDVLKGSSAKRLNMFLRWMVRDDKRGVDFGMWSSIPARALYIPLDVHTGRTSRELGLLNRKQNDWRAVEELTRSLHRFDPLDPVKYDFALFGAGVNSKI
jgi:uncharacterized protein (TIGR02757 family)